MVYKGTRKWDRLPFSLFGKEDEIMDISRTPQLEELVKTKEEPVGPVSEVLHALTAWWCSVCVRALSRKSPAVACACRYHGLCWP